MCYSTDNIYMGIRIFGFVEDIGNSFGRVNGRNGIWHCKQTCDTTCSRTSAACDYILLVGLSGVTKMEPVCRSPWSRACALVSNSAFSMPTLACSSSLP